MPTLNCAEDLNKTIDNIYSQTLETGSRLLIADGGSDDTTIKIIKEKAPKAIIVSSSDKSPEEGINKMLAVDSTNAKIFIGADDKISTGYIEEMKSRLKDEYDKGNDKVLILPKKFINRVGKKYYRSILPIWMLSIAGIGKGIGWLAYNKNGALSMNTSLRYASDYEYLRRCIKEGYRLKVANCIYTHNKKGRSSNSLVKGITEEFHIANKNRKNYRTAGLIATTIFLAAKGLLRVGLFGAKAILDAITMKSLKQPENKDKQHEERFNRLKERNIS